MRSLEMVDEFHAAFGITSSLKPVTLDSNQSGRSLLSLYASRMESIARDLHRDSKLNDANPLLLRLQLCQEELAELARAMSNNDMVECLDALCDMRYVADGTALTLGLQNVLMPALEEVHSSNMSKLGEDGKPIKDEAGRVVKSQGYRPPDLRHFIDQEELCDE